VKQATIAAALVAALALAAPAAATNRAGPSIASQVASLKRQVTSLQKQVNTLKKQTKAQQNALIGIGALALCNIAATADTFQQTFGVVDQIAQGTQGKTYIGAQQAVNDQGLCQALNVPRTQTGPPSLTPFRALLAILGGSTFLQAAEQASWRALRAAP
jgi:hypothetical protein